MPYTINFIEENGIKICYFGRFFQSRNYQADYNGGDDIAKLCKREDVTYYFGIKGKRYNNCFAKMTPVKYDRNTLFHEIGDYKCDEYSYYKMENIKWKLIKETEDFYLLISDKILSSFKYSTAINLFGKVEYDKFDEAAIEKDLCYMFDASELSHLIEVERIDGNVNKYYKIIFLSEEELNLLFNNKLLISSCTDLSNISNWKLRDETEGEEISFKSSPDSTYLHLTSKDTCRCVNLKGEIVNIESGERVGFRPIICLSKNGKKRITIEEIINGKVVSEVERKYAYEKNTFEARKFINDKNIQAKEDNKVVSVGQESPDLLNKACDVIFNLSSQLESIPAIMWMGEFSEFTKKDLKEAASWYKKAADLGSGEGARNYADMLITGNGIDKNIDEAEKYYLIAANKGIPAAMFVLGEIYFNNGNREKSLRFYQDALNAGFEHAKTRIDQRFGQIKTREKVYWRNEKGDIECLGDDCEKENCPDDCPIMKLTVAAGLITLNSEFAYSRAIEILNEVIEIAPDCFDAYNNLGSCYGFLGNTNKAYECFKKAIYIRNDRPGTYNGLIISSIKLNRLDEANKWYDLARKNIKDNELFDQIIKP